MYKLDLKGKWQLKGTSPDGECFEITADVPGSTLSALLNSNIEKNLDVFYRDNADKVQKYENYNWVYSKKIVVSDIDKKLMLVFEKLDTYCDIYINDKHLAACDNGYIPHKAGMIIAAPNWSQFFVQYGTKAEQIGMMAMPAGPKRNVTLLGGGVYLVREDATKDQIDAAIRWIETTNSFKLTEEFKTNYTKRIGKYATDGQLVGIKGMSVWSENSEARNWELNLIDEMANANPNHVRLYNEYVANCPAEIQAEEPVCAQELYSILDGCIQEVLVNKDADCAELIKKAVSDFQANYLDNLTY